AATFTVNSTGNAGVDGNTLRAVIQGAQNGDVVYVGPGLFQPDTPIDIQKNVTIIGSLSGSSITTGANVNATSGITGGFDLFAVGCIGTGCVVPNAVVFRNLTFQSTTQGSALNDKNGGVTVENSLFVNTATQINVTGSSANVTLRDTTVDGDGDTSIGVAAGT